MKKTILFVVNNLSIGGPQKSLISLLYNFPKEYQVDLIVLNNQLDLQKYLPENVNILEISREIPLLMLNKKRILKLLTINLIKNPRLVFRSFIILLKSLFTKSLVQIKQEFWMKNNCLVKKEITEVYDYAIGVSGGHSIMYIVDYIDAKCKVGWIRTEYQNLNRNIQIDHEYFKKLNLILSVSNKSATKFIEFFPDQELKVKTFYNPLPYKMYEDLYGKSIQKDKTYTLSDTMLISTISRIDKNKGFDLIIEAAKYLKEREYNFCWKIYGVGPMVKYIESQIKKYNLEKFIYLKGFEFNTGSILNATDILVHPSKFEGKSNTIDEAKYYGIPIVSTKFPTVSEQLTHEFNAIITELNGESLSKGIIRMVENIDLRNKIRENLESEKEMSRDVFKEFISTLESEAIK